MDPNTTLHELREMVGRALAAKAHLERIGDSKPSIPERSLHELAEKFEALDGWMSKGGFAPDAWRETEDHQ
jgi:hypothetical protein